VSENDREKPEMINESLAWLINKQNKDGGYPAWATSMSRFVVDLLGGRGESKEMFSVLADFSQPDVTGRIMYALEQARRAGGAQTEAFKQAQTEACKYLTEHMDEMKNPRMKLSAGNWMVNYVYSAASVLNGLAVVRCGPEKQAELAEFIMRTQQDSGGWGEGPTGYLTSSYVVATPTIMQSSVALAGLIAYYDSLEQNHQALPPQLDQKIESGIQFLTQKIQRLSLDTKEGLVPFDNESNGVLIRGVTFARYELAPAYLALYAMGRWRTRAGHGN
jgi:squalene cyclase